MSYKLQTDFTFLTKELFYRLQFDKSKDTWNSIQMDTKCYQWNKQLEVCNDANEVDFNFGFGFCLRSSRNNKFFDNNKGFYATFHPNGRIKCCCGYFVGMDNAIWIYYDELGNKTLQGMYFQQEELLGKWIVM